MQFNVATLLREPVGSTRRFDLAAEPVEVAPEHYRRAAGGHVRLLRTARGVLVRAQLKIDAPLECARCLREFETALPLDIEEVFVVERDPVTRQPVPDIAPEEFRIEREQFLDLSEAIRQYELTARPISPLCRPDCLGLCPECGKNLNEGRCACAAESVDGRWSALATLSERLHATEETDGRPEA